LERVPIFVGMRRLRGQLDADERAREEGDLDEFVGHAEGDWSTVHDVELDALADAYGGRDFVAWVQREVDALLQSEALPVPPEHPGYRVLAEQILLAKIKLLNAKNRRARGDWRPDRSLEEYPAYSSPLKPPEPSRKPVKGTDGQGLSVIFAAWCEERSPVSKTRAEFDRAIRRFIELHGDVPAIDITKAMVRTYKEALRKFPAVLSGAQRKMTLPQVLSAVRETPPPKTLSTGAINKDLGSLSAVLAWAGKNGYFDDNPN